MRRASGKRTLTRTIDIEAKADRRIPKYKRNLFHALSHSGVESVSIRYLPSVTPLRPIPNSAVTHTNIATIADTSSTLFRSRENAGLSLISGKHLDMAISNTSGIAIIRPIAVGDRPAISMTGLCCPANKEKSRRTYNKSIAKLDTPVAHQIRKAVI